MGQKANKKAWFRFMRWTHFQLSIQYADPKLQRNMLLLKDPQFDQISKKLAENCGSFNKSIFHMSILDPHTVYTHFEDEPGFVT